MRQFESLGLVSQVDGQGVALSKYMARLCFFARAFSSIALVGLFLL